MPDGYVHVLHRLPGRHTGVEVDSEWGVHVYVERDRGLPKRLREYRSPEHSYERYVENQINGVEPSRQHHTGALYDYQHDQAQRIRTAEWQGAPGYLLDYPTGSGKTAISVASLAETAGVHRVLVVTKLNTVEKFRKEISTFGPGGAQWIVTNPERLWRLFAHPTADLAARDGEEAQKIAAEDSGAVPVVTFDAVIADECHMLTNPEAYRTMLLDKIRHAREDDPAFTLWMSATPFTRPQETGYLADLIAYSTGEDMPPVARIEHDTWLRKMGFKLNKDENKRWYHGNNQDDLDRINSIFFERGVGDSKTASDLGLPTQQRELLPITLTTEQRQQYETPWTRFLGAAGLGTVGSTEPTDERAYALRMVQKASLVKVPHIAREAARLVAAGDQVVIMAWFLDSVRSTTTECQLALEAHGLPTRVTEITGEDHTTVRELKRKLFQLGGAKILVTNVSDGINLHAGEAHVGENGGNATEAPRTLIISDVLTGGKRALQAEGRTHRDGTSSHVLYAYAADTHEQDWQAVAFREMSNTLALSRRVDASEGFAELAEALRRPRESRER